MEEEEGGPRLSKRFGDNKGGGGGEGEVDFKTKSGTAWSHSFLNQKPWHPLSYPNQRRKWIAEQTHAQRARRAEEVAREYAQEQDFFRQTALVSKKEKEKMEMMKAVSFMYVRPPGYNAESAIAAEVADEQKTQEQDGSNQSIAGASSSKKPESMPPGDDKKKPRPKDVFGRSLPTEEQFEVLKNAPRMETGVYGRAKPFGVEIRNVKCVRCGNFGHQSGDRECPLKDVIMPNEENRLKRDDPLTAILAQTDAGEPLKWELKQKPGLSPPRGGFQPDDPNQQIVAEEIFDQYGGFLSGDVPDLLANLSSRKPKKKSSKSKHKRRMSPIAAESNGREENVSSSEDDRIRRSKKRHRRKSQKHSESSPSKPDYHGHHKRRSRHRRSCSSSSDHSDSDEQHRYKHRSHRKHMQSRSSSSDHPVSDEHHKRSSRHRRSWSSSSDHSDSDEQKKTKHRSHRKQKQSLSSSSDHSDCDEQHRREHRSYHKRMKFHTRSSNHSNSDGQRRRDRSHRKHTKS